MKRILVAFFALAFTLGASAQKTVSLEGADETVRLWDNTTAKYSNYETHDEEWRKGKKLSIKHTSSCELYIYKAVEGKNNGVAIAIFPGGGYANLNFSVSLAKWYASQGVTAALVKYRLPNYGHNEATLEDATGAVKYLRTRTDLGIKPTKVGVTGSSAGGHLAAWVSNAMPDNEKPAFAVLHYAAITRSAFYTGVKANALLLGEGYCYQDAVDMSANNMVTSTTPPTLLLLCDDDNVVPSVSSVAYYKALIRHGVKASIHIYPQGGHSLTKHITEQNSAIVDWLEWLGLTDKTIKK